MVKDIASVLRYREMQLNAVFYLHENDKSFAHRTFQYNENERLYTIAWNRGEEQTVTVDGIDFAFAKNAILPLMVNQQFSFAYPEDVIGFQFNREFYCIIDHDKDVSCAGFLFYGVNDVQILLLAEEEVISFNNLLQVFREEFLNNDHVQGEMLRMLLKRLIIKVTRLARQHLLPGNTSDVEYDMVREFKVAVERHYRKEHSVTYYAGLLNKSPKTLSNVFNKLHDKTPLEVIHERIALESRRLLLYTDKSAKEIAYELGFEEAANFSRFFKKAAGISPTEFRHERLANTG